MIKGFSRLSKSEKVDYLIQNKLDKRSAEILYSLTHSNSEIATLIEGFSENVLSHYPFPYSIAPNFLINNKSYIIPMVTEESSVVAAASKSATYWFSRGGFKTEVIGTIKNGQVHFMFDGSKQLLSDKFAEWKKALFDSVDHIDSKMRSRGGGIKEIQLIDQTNKLKNYFQIDVSFDTRNAMGANYMNSCLEGIAEKFKELVEAETDLHHDTFDIIMAILSNYSPNNAIKVYAECPVSQLKDSKMSMHHAEFAKKFREAVEIAKVDISRAVTHNKGIYNGIDAVAIATGNDWRAIEANGHAYASKDGNYSSLSDCIVEDNFFRFEATIPMQIGTVGGTTSLHPMAKLSMKILGEPSSVELMKIIAAAGLAQNFGAIKSLITTGIQKGHMKMHLSNILTAFVATESETELAKKYFSDKTITYSEVEKYLDSLRNK